MLSESNEGGGSVFVRAALLGVRGFNYRLGGERGVCVSLWRRGGGGGCTTSASAIEWVISR